MSKHSPLSRSELEIAQVLWKLGEATVRQIHNAIPAQRGVDFWTVQTLLRRMESKEYVRSTMQGRTRTYRPRVKARTVIKRLTDDFVKRVFDGRAMPLVQQLIQSQELTTEEIEQLRELLDREAH